MRGHHVFGTEFSVAEKEQFWQEWLDLGRLMGVPAGDLPETWDGFQAYLHQMIDTVLVYNDVIEVAQNTAAHAAGGSPFAWLPPQARAVAGRPLGRYGAFLARGTMGPKLRDKFRIPWSPRQQWVFLRVAAAHRAARPVMPPALRVAGPMALRLRRREIADGPFA